MKIAIFHNYLDNIGGAEIVTLTLARHFDADLYTTNIDTEKITKMGFGDVIPRIKSIGKVPIKAPFKHELSSWRFRKLNLGRQYDFYVIAGDWALSGAVNNKPNLWYVHSPLNELWQWKDYIKNVILNWWQRPIFDVWVFMKRILSKKYSKHVNIWVCNSRNTQGRIKRFYNQDAIIINPPVDTKKYTNNGDGGYWLSVNRLTTPKRIELQVKAFQKLKGKKLIIVGSYEKGASQFEEYKRKIGDELKDSESEIEILHFLKDEDLKKLYSECKGFITTAMDEDFGMTVVEAMASGKPVIAANEGGYKESVISGENGILIDEIDADKIATAIVDIENNLLKDPNRYKEPCINRAKKFDTEVFIEKIRNQIDNYGKRN
jgi:glycosyltransferase involved in cell wall biosynthesis